MIASLHNPDIKNNPQRISNLKKFENCYDWSGLSFPTSLKEIKNFEVNNGISVNILGLKGKDIYTLRKGANLPKEVNLLLISEKGVRHYISIKSLSRLLTSRNTKRKCKQHFCKNCSEGFSAESSRDKHYSYCVDNKSVRVKMPTKSKSILKFSDGQGQLKAPFVTYADFESILEPIQGCKGDPTISHTDKINKHTPSGFCTYSAFAYRKVQNPTYIYRGKDCVEKLCEHIRLEAHRLFHMFPEKPMDPLTDKQWKKYNKAKVCHIFLKPINFMSKDPKVRDHCHYTGKFRGAAQRSCNLNYKVPSYIPVVFHNMSGYDAHLFIKELAKLVEGKVQNIKVIAKNKENYIRFSTPVVVDEYTDRNRDKRDKTIDLRFIDSFKFLASSLDSLTNNLVKGGIKLFRLPNNIERYNLLTRKGVYPYEYMDSWDKFDETSLPSREKFYSELIGSGISESDYEILTGSGISESDYEHAKKVWDEFNIKNLGDYHDLYLKTDVWVMS